MQTPSNSAKLKSPFSSGAGKENVTPGGVADLIQSASKVSPALAVMSKKETASRFGLECTPAAKGVDSIVFENWKPGAEYVQKLILRNVCTDVVKVKYQLPRTRFFSLAFPEVFTLVPGTFKDIDVVFRPTEYQGYDDGILVNVLSGPSTGGFLVPVKAAIKKLIISAPSGVDLGFCPAHQMSTTTFTIHNTGEISAPFRFDCPAPFVLEPTMGSLAVGAAQVVTVSLFPTDASVVVSQVLCHVGEGVTAAIPDPLLKIKIGAIGKFGFVSLSESELSFGEVLTGTAHSSPLLRKEIVLKNPSPVPTDFSVSRVDSDSDGLFSVEPRAGQVPARGEVAVVVRYSPLAAGTYSCDRFLFQTPGHNKQTMVCRGMAISPRISLYKDRPGGAAPSTVYKPGSPAWAVSFNNLEVGQHSTRVFFLHNNGAAPSSYSICCDESSIFSFSPLRGVVPAQARVAVTVGFSPHMPLNFYKRVFVLFADAPPSFVDVFGSGYVDANGEVKEQRPAPLRHAHVQASRNRHAAGMGAMDPDALEELYHSYLQEGGQDAVARCKLFALPGDDGTPPLKTALQREPLTRSGESTRALLGAAHELHGSDGQRLVELQQDSVDFGHVERGAVGARTRSVILRNHTDSKVTAVWYCGAAAQQPPFSVQPAVADVPARGSCSFEVCFAPTQEDRNYHSTLEAHVFFKNQRTFRLVSDATLTAPWSVQLSVSGHSFAYGQLLAKARFSGHNVQAGTLRFPRSFVGDSSFQSIVLRNSSDLPGTFRLTAGPAGGSSSGAFSAQPREGVVGANDFVIISVRCRPPQGARSCSDVLRCEVNGFLSDTLLMEGQAQLPYLFCPQLGCSPSPPGAAADTLSALPQGLLGSFSLKPTCIGLSSSRALVFRNGSRLPLRYSAALQGDDEGVATVSEPRGVVRGNEDLKLTVLFAPRAAVPYRLRLRVTTYPVAGEPEGPVLDAMQIGGVQRALPLQTIDVRLAARGEVGALLFDPPRLALAPRLVQQTETREIWLENISDCTIRYDLEYVCEHSSSMAAPAAARRRQSRPVPSTSEAGRAAPDEHLFCAAPQGVVSARCRMRVLFTFLPQTDGLFEFFVLARLTSLNTEGSPSVLSNEEALLLRLSADERRGALTGDLTLPALRQLVAALPCSACITASASFPTVVFDDVRPAPTTSDDVEQLWKQLSLSALNAKLQQPLSAAEAQLFRKSSPDLSRFDRVCFQFTPAAQDSASQELNLRMTNTGLLPAHFTFHWPTDKTLNLEQWCDEDDPGEEIMRIVDVVETLRLFSFEPRSGSLSPGESVTFSLSYSFASTKYNGLHKIPVLLRLTNGRALFIDLVGQTLERSSSSRALSTVRRLAAKPCVSMPAVARNIMSRSRSGVERYLLCGPTGATGLLLLPSVPVGLSPTASLRQEVELRNVSTVAISYTVDSSGIDALNEQFGFPVLAIPQAAGVVPPGAAARLSIYMCPMAAQWHRFELRVSYRAADSVLYGEVAPVAAAAARGPVTDNCRNQEFLRGAAREPRVHITDPSMKELRFQVEFDAFDARAPPRAPLQGLPRHQATEVTGQLASVSQEVLSFGALLQGTRSHRLTVVRNISPHPLAVLLRPNSSALFDQGLVRISPSAFTLERGEHAVVDFSVDATCGNCHFYDSFLLVARESLAAPASRRQAVKAPAMELRAAATRAPRLSVVVTATAGSDAKLIGAAADGGAGGERRGSLPTSIDIDGSLLQPPTRYNIGQQTVSCTEPAGDLASAYSGTAYSGTVGSRRADGSALRSQSAPGGSRAETRSRASVLSAAPSVSYESYEVLGGALLGPETFLNIRLRGSIFDRRTMQAVAPAAMRETFAPAAEPFVPSDGSAPTRGPSDGARQALPVPLRREGEVRAAVEAVACSLFRDVLSEEALRDSLAGALRQTRLSGRLAMDASGRVRGRPPYGVYWRELTGAPAPPRAAAVEAGVPQLQELLLSEPFMGGVVQDVLRNTFLNILQEVSHGEYSLGCLDEGEEPLQLVTAK